MMANAITQYAPFSLHRFHIPVASCFSNDGGRENMWIECKLPEISDVFFVKAVRREKCGTLSAARLAAPRGKADKVT